MITEIRRSKRGLHLPDGGLYPQDTGLYPPDTGLCCSEYGCGLAALTRRCAEPRMRARSANSGRQRVCSCVVRDISVLKLCESGAEQHRCARPVRAPIERRS